MGSAGPRYFGFVVGGGSLDGAARRRLPHHRLGPDRLQRGDLARGDRGRGRRRRLAEGPPRPPGVGVGRVRHRGAGGEHRRAGGRPSPGAAPGRVGRRARRAGRRASRAGGRGRRAARHGRSRAAVARARRGTLEEVAGRRERRDRRGRARRGAGRRVRGARRSSASQAGNVNTGACDDLAAGDRARPPARRLGARGRRVRVVGGGEPAHPPPGRRDRARRLLGVRRAQVAERALRLRLRVLCPPRRPRGRHGVHRVVPTGQGRGRDCGGGDFVPESSRRARGFATWAALRELGRDGVADLVDRCCRLARRFADGLARTGRDRQRRRAQPGAGPLR